MTVQIQRRGFRSRVPFEVVSQAEKIVSRQANDSDFPVERLIATLRPAAYCGPGSGGDRGAYTLEIVHYYRSGSSQTGIFPIERRVAV